MVPLWHLGFKIKPEIFFRQSCTTKKIIFFNVRMCTSDLRKLVLGDKLCGGKVEGGDVN